MAKKTLREQLKDEEKELKEKYSKLVDPPIPSASGKIKNRHDYTSETDFYKEWPELKWEFEPGAERELPKLLYNPAITGIYLNILQRKIKRLEEKVIELEEKK